MVAPQAADSHRRGVDERGALKLSDPLIYDYPGAEVAVYGHGASHGSVSNLRLEYEADGYNAFAGAATTA